MRKARKLKDHAIYHITAKANRSEFIFEDDYFKDMFLEVMKEAKKKYKFRIKNFTIMSNHVHIAIKPLGDSCLSDIMRWILATFAIRYNNSLKIHGHVWYDRFTSVIFETYSHYLAAMNYIDNNPVKAGLVEKPEDYAYSGITFLKNKVYEIIDPPDIGGYSA